VKRFQTEVELGKGDSTLMQLLESSLSQRQMNDDNLKKFTEIHESDNYDTELKVAANLLFCSEYKLSQKFAKLFYNFESEFHSRKIEDVHICMKRHLVKKKYLTFLKLEMSVDYTLKSSLNHKKILI
jgi:hypothetical protein